MNMQTKSRPVLALRNIGVPLAAKLKSVGITDETELRTVGAIGAFRRLVRRYPSTGHSLWICLFSLEGAIRNLPWNKLPKEKMKELLRGLASQQRVSC